MFERILVPLDGGPTGLTALRVADRLADLWNVRLDVLTLLTLGDDAADVEKNIEAQLETIARGAKMSVRPVHFSVPDDIADELEITPNTLVVMASSARPRAAGLVSSTAETVLSYIDGPALLVGPNVEVDADWPRGSLFVCTDGSDFAEQIVAPAADLARSVGLHPWVLSVAAPSEGGAVDVRTESAHVANVAKVMAPAVQRTVDYDVLHNTDPTKAIVDYASERDAAIIALATHGRTGLIRLAFGSVAIGVVHDAPCPVLVQQPKESLS